MFNDIIEHDKNINKKDVIILKKKNIIYSSIIVLVLILLYVFMPKDIFINPLITPENYLATKPYIELFNRWIIIVPSSSLIVFILGVQILILSLFLIKVKQKLWGVSLLFWGVGTILAGMSYQTFGYELKCSGQTYCLFTSWFELAYLFTTAISISLMTFAFAHTFTKNKTNIYLIGYGKIALVVYTIILILGAVLNNQIMISYELFTIFYMPLFLIFFIINVLNYRKNKNKLDYVFIVLWLLFLLVNVSYYVYYFLGFTSSLYDNTGIWFSANDVLHVALILWFVYFQFKVKKELIK